MPSRNEKPTKKQPKVQASRIFEVFAGSYVNVVARQIEVSGEGAVVLQLKGYFLDCDDEFIYIGQSPIEVAAAIKRNEIVTIALDSGDIPDTGDMQ